MNKYTVLLTTALLAASVPAFAATSEDYETSTKVKKDSNGNYSSKSKSEATDAQGTTRTSERNEEVSKDSSGNVTRKVETSNSVDPKGLFNKQTAQTTDTVKENSNGTVETRHKKKVNGKTVESYNDTSRNK